MKPRKHQQQLLDQNPNRFGLWWPCGTGKTMTAIKLIEQQDVAACLVVCPKSVKENWQREIDKWKAGTVVWVIVTKEEFRRDWGKINLEGQGVIFDEGHYFGGYKSQMHKAAMKWLSKNHPKATYLLTATPMLSTPYNVMCYEKMLGRMASWPEYRNKYFTFIRMGGRMIPQVRKDAGPKLAKILQEMGSTVIKEECLDLPDQVFLQEDFALTADQKKGIVALDDDATTVNQIVYWTKCHQVNGGTVKDDSELGYIKYKSEKAARVKEYAKQHPKMAIVCRYNAEIDMLHKMLPNSYVLNGAVPGDKRQAIIDEVNDSDEAVILINAAVSEGYNLTGVSMMVFYSNSFSYKDRVQMEGRIHRIGQTKKCTYIDFVVKGTVDEDVLKALKNKEDFYIELYDRSKSNTRNNKVSK